MRGVPYAFFLLVFWALLSVQVESRISARGLSIRAPQDPGPENGPGKGAGNGNGKGPGPTPPGLGKGKKLNQPKPTPQDIPSTTSTTTSQSTSSAEVTSTTSTVSSSDPPTTTSTIQAPPPPPQTTSEVSSTTIPPFFNSNPVSNLLPTSVGLPRLSFIPTMISAVLPTPPNRGIQTLSQTTELPTAKPDGTTLPPASLTTTIFSGTKSPSAIPDSLTKVPAPSSGATGPQRTLVIVLSVVLGSIGVLLVALVIFLICRFRKRKARRRGVSPIDDQEIESWRNVDLKSPIRSPTRPQIEPPQPLDRIEIVPAPLASPGWDWFSADGMKAPTPAHSRGPSMVAQAPNARRGLTTDAIPGAEPFVAPVRRQSSRLSKAQRGPHARSKSMRSSTSARSLQSLHIGDGRSPELFRNEFTATNWFASDNMSVPSHAYSAAETSSIGTTVYDEFNNLGGLSPRPRPPAPMFPNFGSQGGLSPAPRPRQDENEPSSMMPQWPLRANPIT